MGFELMNGLTDHLYIRLRISNNYSATANFQNSNITTALTKSFPARYVFTSRFLETALTVEIL
jgi:hypothetical protein